jgi:hypothetical protein
MADSEPVAPIDPQSAVNLPAISLMVLGGLGVALSLLAAVVNFLGGGMGAMAGGRGEQIPAFLSGTVGGLINLAACALYALLFYGAYQMKTLKSYPLAMTGAIAAMLPCSCCCVIGLPIGIWAIVVLLKPAVKQAFESNRAQPA